MVDTGSSSSSSSSSVRRLSLPPCLGCFRRGSVDAGGGGNCCGGCDHSCGVLSWQARPWLATCSLGCGRFDVVLIILFNHQAGAKNPVVSLSSGKRGRAWTDADDDNVSVDLSQVNR